MSAGVLIAVTVILSLIILAIAIYLLILYIHRNPFIIQLTTKDGELHGIARY
jgi:hypothetical protein